ncbi:MAG: DUF418 domain-containing protein [Ilumatobacteraceae bacterium]
MTDVFVARPQINRTGAPRLPGLDVTRAIALIGVVVMNYHGYLNGGSGGRHRSYAEHVFDTSEGPLSTRFAATFVLVAGMGITLMTNRSRAFGDRSAISEDRWRLIRRGLLLYSFGLLIEWIWHGTILFFYGAFFIVGALLFTLALRWLAVIAVSAALAGAAIAWFAVGQRLDGHDTRWLDPPVTSPRNLLLRTFVGYTHPLLPWLVFLCAGIALGRFLPLATAERMHLRTRILAIGLAMFAGTYAINFVGLRWATDSFKDRGRTALQWRAVLSTAPFDRGMLYTIGTLGSSLIAFCLISWVADQFSTSQATRLLQHAGQMTLTLYVCHVLVFNAMVHWWGLVDATGLDTALVFALVFWVFAIAFGAMWHRLLGTGPLERLYRKFGG